MRRWRAGGIGCILKRQRIFGGQGIEPFHPFVEIAFEVPRADEHYHVPLLLTPYGYSTYRGS